MAESQPPEDWMPEDGRVADISHWGTYEEAEAATDPEVIERIRARREAFLAGKNPDADDSPLRVG